MTLTKAIIAEAISKKMSYSNMESLEMLDSLLEIMKQALESGETTSVAATQAMLDRIVAVDNHVKGYLLVSDELALEQAAMSRLELPEAEVEPEEESPPPGDGEPARPVPEHPPWTRQEQERTASWLPAWSGIPVRRRYEFGFCAARCVMETICSVDAVEEDGPWDETELAYLLVHWPQLPDHIRQTIVRSVDSITPPA